MSIDRPRLHSAAAGGDAASIESLLAQGEGVDLLWAGGWTALHLASDEGHIDAVATLLRAGAAPSISDHEFGQTPLHLAAFRGNTEVVRSLLAAGAQADQADGSKNTALHLAAQGGEGTLTTSMALLSQSARVNAINADGQTPLMFAALSSNLSVIALLLARNADRTLLGVDGDDALAVARRQYSALHTGRRGTIPARNQPQAKAVLDIIRLLEE